MKITYVVATQTYLDAPTIQSMLASLRKEAQGREMIICRTKKTVGICWHYAEGKGTGTFDEFKDLNYWKNELRKERKHLSNLVKQIKGLKAMLKDAP